MTWWIWLTIGIVVGIAIGRHGLAWCWAWLVAAYQKIAAKFSNKTV